MEHRTETDYYDMEYPVSFGLGTLSQITVTDEVEIEAKQPMGFHSVLKEGARD